MKTQYEMQPETRKPNFDKISGAESSSQILSTTERNEDKPNETISGPEPVLDLDDSETSKKRNIDKLFKVLKQ